MRVSTCGSRLSRAASTYASPSSRSWGTSSGTWAWTCSGAAYVSAEQEQVEAARRAAAAEALRRHEEEDDFYEAFDPLYF